jgi:hypothetical protein
LGGSRGTTGLVLLRSAPEESAGHFGQFLFERRDDPFGRLQLGVARNGVPWNLETDGEGLSWGLESEFTERVRA